MVHMLRGWASQVIMYSCCAVYLGNPFFFLNFLNLFIFLPFTLIILQKLCIFNVNDSNAQKLNRNYLKFIQVTNTFSQYCTL